MIVKGYDVYFEAKEGRLVTYRFNDNLRSIVIELPEEIKHPAFDVYFVKVCDDLLTGRTMLHDTVSHTVKRRNNNVASQSFSKVVSRMIKEYGDLDDYKMRWDCNLPPKNHTATGKYADLKAFIEQRKGGKP